MNTLRPLMSLVPLVVAIAISTLITTPATSQARGSETPDAVDEEVTVTAQRVEQALQEVPISIIALDADELEHRALDDIQGLGEEAPGLIVTGQDSSTGEVALTIRGIGSNTFGLGTESTVGYYVDGVYIPRPQGFLNQFLDLERIEVLRGPQGTLWGRNSTGGALNVVTKTPSANLGGRLFASYGDYDSVADATERQLSASVTGSFSDRVLGRFSAAHSKADDYTFNQFLGTNSDSVDGINARGSLQFLLSDSSTLLLRADLNDYDNHNNFSLRPNNTAPTSALGTLLRFYGFQVPSDVYTITANVPPVSEYDESGLSLDFNKILGDSNIELQSITSYREFGSQRSTDIDGTQLTFVQTLGDFDVDWYSQEFTLNGSNDRLSWIAGAYYFHENGFSNIDTLTDFGLFEVQFFANNPGLFLFNPANFCSIGFFAPTFLCGIDYYNALAPGFGLRQPGTISSGNLFVTDLETDSYAGYGQVYFDLSDRWTLTAGLRYTKDEKTHSQSTIDFLTQAPATFVDSDSWDGFTPKLGIEFRPQDDVMLYGSITTGFKSGGFNSISVQPSFDEETVTSYEIGGKSVLAQGAVVLNGALFHYDYDDLQVAVLFPNRSSVENAAQATVDGAEIDLIIRPSRQLRFDLGLSFLDSEYDDFVSQDPQLVGAVQDALNAVGIFDPEVLAIAGALVPPTDLSGESLQRAPDFSANAALQYTFFLGDAGTLTARGQYSYNDDVKFDPFGNLGQESYSLINANLRYAADGGRWFVNLYGRNLGDEQYITTEIFARVTGSLQSWAAPRSVGVQVGFNF